MHSLDIPSTHSWSPSWPCTHHALANVCRPSLLVSSHPHVPRQRIASQHHPESSSEPTSIFKRLLNFSWQQHQSEPLSSLDGSIGGVRLAASGGVVMDCPFVPHLRIPTSNLNLSTLPSLWRH